MVQPDIPDQRSTALPVPRRLRKRRWLRLLCRTLWTLLLVLAVFLGWLWWWSGSNGSLAFVLEQASRFIPQGQSLRAQDVAGSLRKGGHIGALHWSGPTLQVDVLDIQAQWNLAALLRGLLLVEDLRARQVRIVPAKPAQPTVDDAAAAQPLEALTLPIDIELPLQVEEILWGDPAAAHIRQLGANYRYVGGQHTLDINTLEFANGQYRMQAQLDGAAPMNLQAALDVRMGLAHATQEQGGALPAEEAPDPVALAMDVKLQGPLGGTKAALSLSADLAQIDNAQQALQALVPASDLIAQARAHATSTTLLANVQATIAPWAKMPLAQVSATLNNVDPARLWPGAPVARLDGELHAATLQARPQQWEIQGAIRNAQAGAWDAKRLPVQHIALQAAMDMDTQAWEFPRIDVALPDGGAVQLRGNWAAAQAGLPWKVQADIHQLSPASMMRTLQHAPLNGTVSAQQQGEAVELAATLDTQQSAAFAGTSHADPGIDALQLHGQWHMDKQELTLDTLHVEAFRMSLQGTAQASMPAESAQADIEITLPGAKASLKGHVAPTQGQGGFQAELLDAAQWLAWLQSLPGLPAGLKQHRLEGAAQLQAQWTGGWKTLQQFAQGRISPQEAQKAGLALDASLSAAQLAWKHATLPQSATLATQVHAQLGASGTLNATLQSLNVQLRDAQHETPWTAELSAPVQTAVTLPTPQNGTLSVQASQGQIKITAPQPGTLEVNWDPLRYSLVPTARGAHQQRLRTTGQIKGLYWQWGPAIMRLAGQEMSVLNQIAGDLVLGAQWDVQIDDALQANVVLERQGGDLLLVSDSGVIRMDGSNGGASAPTGLRQARLAVQTQGANVDATLLVDSEKLGQIKVDAVTSMVQKQGAWTWAEDAPLGGNVHASIPDMGVWAFLAPPGWRIKGSAQADIQLSGSRAQPHWQGTLGASDLAVRSTVDGFDLQNGTLAASIDGNHLHIETFTLQGSQGAITRIRGIAGSLGTGSDLAQPGLLRASGDVYWDDPVANTPFEGADTAPPMGGLRMNAKVQLQAMRLLARADRQITLSGEIDAHMDKGKPLTVSGNLRTDRAVFILADLSAPTLDTDVVILPPKDIAVQEADAQEARQDQAMLDAAQQKRQAAAAAGEPLPEIDIGFDLGDDFAVQGYGLTARLGGQLQLHSAASTEGALRLVGDVNIPAGQFRAYDQKLDVQKGTIRFNGAPDNPSLDIIAIRPQLEVVAGVQVLGTARSPRVVLYSETDMPDTEKLSWVLFGHGSAGGSAESAALQKAAMALLSGSGGGLTGSIAGALGLDEIGVGGTSVSMSKRLSDKLYVSYERSLVGTTGALSVFYDITRRLTLRGSTGAKNILEMVYTLTYD